MSEFELRWKWVKERGITLVQEMHELEHVYNLMKGCNSYLEVGTAEGNTLYVLGGALNEFKYQIEYIDLCESHTERSRNDAILKLGKKVFGIKGDSTHKATYDYVRRNSYDCVLIDGGHDFATVLSDCILYAPLARKYVFFHDVQLEPVRTAVEWFAKNWKLGEYSTYIRSTGYGYGIIKCSPQQ